MPVNLQDTPTAGPIRAIDLERDINTGRIYHLHRTVMRQCPPCTGDCRQGRDCTAPDTVPTDFDALDSCAAEGGKHAEPVATKTQKARPGIGIALVLAPWLAGVIGWALYVRWH